MNADGIIERIVRKVPAPAKPMERNERVAGAR
jgi:hypothetical protein